MSDGNKSKPLHIKKLVFWPPFALICLAIAMNFTDKKAFLDKVTFLNDQLLTHFDGLFIWGALLIFVTALVIAALPFGKTRLGGPNAQPLLKPWNWIAVTLCTNTAVGILFWASAEPMYHLNYPPTSLGIAPLSPEAGDFALSTLFMHWSLIPCAIYALPAVMFAFAFYNMKTSFSLSGTLSPIFGRFATARLSSLIDAVCLYALVAGMAASLATGVLTLAGGLEHLYQIESNPTTWMLVTLAIVATFIASATTGLHRGISFLSNINIWVFFFLAGFIIIVGPTFYILTFGLKSLGTFAANFWQQSTFSGFLPTDTWPKSWTIFYWANWLAWAPVTALFLGRIGYGYSVRTFMAVNLFMPATFAIVWMSIFGGTAIHMELLQQLGLSAVLTERGPEGLIYHIFAQYPLAQLVIPLFLFSVFISYVSGADANTSAMAGMSSHAVSHEDSEPPRNMKILWGLAVGTISVVMLTAAGVDGIKMMSNLGGFPALIFELLVVGAILKVAFSPKKYDLYANTAVKSSDADNNPATLAAAPAIGDK